MRSLRRRARWLTAPSWERRGAAKLERLFERARSRRGFRVCAPGPPCSVAHGHPPTPSLPGTRDPTEGGESPRHGARKEHRRVSRCGQGCFAKKPRCPRAWVARRRTRPGGERGIRTLGTLTGTPDFESGSFGHSDSSPPRTVQGPHRVVKPRSGRAMERRTVFLDRPAGVGAVRGEMTEWPKVHDWKSCVPARVPRVRIPLSPQS
jgi:hypothetical protein